MDTLNPLLDATPRQAEFDEGSSLVQTLGRSLRASRWRVMSMAIRYQRASGVPGLFVPLLLIALTALDATMAYERARTQEMAAALRQRRAVASVAPASAVRPAEEESLAAFSATLVGQEDVPAVVLGLLQTSEQFEVRVPQGDYKFLPVAAADFARFEVEMPVLGRGAAISKYVQAMLLRFPALAISGVQMKRDSLESDLLEARLHWVLFVTSDETDSSRKGNSSARSAQRERSP